MIALITGMVLILMGIAIWQISNIYKLIQNKMGKEKDDSQIANEKDNDTQGKLMFAFLVFIYLVTIYCFWAYTKVLLPESASEHGVPYDRLLWISFAIILFAQTITQAVLHYFAYKYRGINNRKAFFITHDNNLELVWTVIPAFVFFGLIIYGMVTWGQIMNFDDQDEDALVIELYAAQWNWKARYGGQDNVLGDANVRFLNDFDGRNSVGIDSSDPNGWDDIVVSQEFHIPVNRKVIFKMRSQDVLHSAYMPHFRAQMNCVPGMITEFAFTPTITTADMRMNPDVASKVERINKIRYDNSQELIANGEEGLEPYQFDYLLLCAKICGSSHYNMQMKIIVDSEKDYNKWIQQQPAFSSIMQ
ncbi:MAG: cytochrome C oxidase subunit II [Flavobacteriales bacterium]|nr:cytochrome C oxidase subunit II [Flavobacteriales bacterium]MAV81744.1 cytochrome C oxidase subunit II [Flavobacteriales bacterium]|tara:strand:- start:4596 stop:5678 length:1083 start_codon:yes stop_codon:yes gene_type:complete